MARAKANEPLRSKTKPNAVEEVTRGIATLRELSVQIEDLSRDGFPYREAVRARTELSFRETIRRLFGEKSPEYQAHKNHKLRVGSRAESAQSTALLKEFIAALEIQKAELLGLKPDEVIAVVRAEPDRPSLTVVAIATSPDAPSASVTMEPAVVSVPSPPTPAAIGMATSGPLSSSLSPTSSASPLVVPLTPIPAKDAVPSPPRDPTALRPIQQTPPADAVPTESARALQVDMARPPVTPPPPAVVAPATPPPTSSSSARSATDAPIPTTTIPPVVPTVTTIPRGTIPPVPQTTLRPQPVPSISTESPVPPQAIAIITTAQAPTPAQIVTPPQSAAPSSATHDAGADSLPVPETRTTAPIIETKPPEPMNEPPTLQQESAAPPPAVQAARPIQPSPLPPTQIMAPDQVQETKARVNDGTLDTLRRVCARFHLVARQLRLRKEYRPTLEINDEYDLQDLFYALLRLQFDEVGTEDWSPPYANGARRTSYLLDWEKTAVVVKQTRSGLSSKDLAEQVAADKVHYSARPNGATLVCFIYDPEGRVGNPRGLEADLTSTEDTYRVEVIVAPK